MAEAQVQSTLKVLLLRHQNDMTILLRSARQQIQLLQVISARIQNMNAYYKVNPFATIDYIQLNQLLTEYQTTVNKVNTLNDSISRLATIHQNEWSAEVLNCLVN